MIPRANITAWRRQVPWSLDAQVEQDLVLSRVLVEIFADPFLADELVFRGGTALHKLFLTLPTRYSEDIDLVQIRTGAAGPLIDAFRSHLDSWLGIPKRKRSKGRVTLIYSYKSEIQPVTPLKMKIELNTREHFNVLGLRKVPFAVQNPWFTSKTEIVTYEIEEILATKLRALYQRKKGRDLFDLDIALRKIPSLDVKKVVDCFDRYINHDKVRITRAKFEANLKSKINDSAFINDIYPLLTSEANMNFDVLTAYENIHKAFITKLER